MLALQPRYSNYTLSSGILLKTKEVGVFGILTRSKIKKLRAELAETQKLASHFYKMKHDAEERAFVELCDLSIRMGVEPDVAAKTQEGVNILADVVLNRQYAFYLNEKAIQIYSQIFLLEKRRGTRDREEWLNEVVKKSGWEVVSSELPFICADLIEEAKERLSDG
ncbi:hypothetical protein G914_00823 [Escherichia coli UMEA 3139-1]|nr:hypothetical protein G914_00823 [Escherichia coli UMEA 3139-1]